MKKTYRILAALLAILLMVTSVPMARISAFAAEDANIILGAGELTRAQWLHNLVYVFDLATEEEYLPDNYFTDLADTHEYYIDILTAVDAGIVDLPAGSALEPDALATREFAVSTLNYLLGYQLTEAGEYTFGDSADCADPVNAQIALNCGWLELIEGNFEPTAALTEQEVEGMLEDAASTLEEKVIDAEYESTFELSEDVVIIPEGTRAEEENGILMITDCPEPIEAEDVFAVYENGIPVVYRAVSVEQYQEITMIETEAFADGAFSSVDAEGMIGSGEMEVIPAEGVELTVDEEVVSSYALDGSVPLKTFTFSKSLSIAGITGEVKLTMDNPSVKYRIKMTSVYVALCGQATITYSIGASMADMAGLDPITIGTIIVGGIGSLDLNLEVDVSGSVSGNVEGWLEAGLTASIDGIVRPERTFRQTSSYMNVDVEAKIGLQLAFGITKLPVVTALVYFEIGIKANLTVNTYDDPQPPHECVGLSAYLYAEYGAEASLDFAVCEFTKTLSNDIFDDSNSPLKVVMHFEDGRQVTACTRDMDPPNYATAQTTGKSIVIWSGADHAYGINNAGEEIALYDYELNSTNEAIITAYKGNAQTVCVPATIDDYPVVEIGREAFEGKAVRNVVLPDSVRTIGYAAFSDCYYLKSITIPDSLSSLGNRAFYECSSLESVEIPTGISAIGSKTFSGCGALGRIVIPDNIIEIDDEAFYDCGSLKKVTLSKNLTTLGDSAFGYTAIEEITLPKVLNSCGFNLWSTNEGLLSTGPFAYCDKLKTVVFEANTNKIPDYLFASCTGLESIVIPDTVATIGIRAFNGCTGLKDVTIGNAVSYLGDGSFSFCASLEEIEIPDSVQEIDEAAFRSSIALKDVVLSAKLTTLGKDAFMNTAIEEIKIPKLLNSCGYDLWSTNEGLRSTGPFAGCANLKTVTLEEGMTAVAAYLLAGCTGLESIVIPDTVATIGIRAFNGCTGLKDVTIGNAVSYLGDGSFSFCTSLEELEIPDSVQEIDEAAFRSSTSLKDVVLSAKLTTLGKDAFMNTAIEEIKIPKLLNSCGYDLWSTNEGLRSTGPFAGCANLKTVTLEEGMTAVAAYLLAGCTGIESIVIPDTVATVGIRAFNGCTGLKDVTIGNAVSYLGDGSFSFCTSLEEIEIPDSVQEIDDDAFRYSTALKKIALPRSVKTLGDNAFLNCVALEEITFADYSLTAIGANTFKECVALTEVVLPKGLTRIYDQAFMNAGSLVKVTIPESVTAISTDAFNYPTKTTICGKAGSYAETFATAGGFTFEDICIPVEGMMLKDGVEEIDLQAGDTFFAEFEFYPEDANEVVTLTASNNNVTITGHEIYAAKAGDTVITATASGGVTCEFTVHVKNPPELTGIYIETLPDKLQYEQRESLDLTGLVVMGTYTDDQDRLITDYSVSGYNALKKGVQTITITYEGKTATFDVSVGVVAEPGDVSGNGVLDTGDVVSILQFLTEGTPVDESLADFNGDGEVRISDAVMILRQLSGNIAG